MELFTLDIGNTNTRYGLFIDDELKYCSSYSTNEIDKLKIPEGIPVAAASVVPRVNSKVQADNIFWVNYKLKMDVDLSLVDAAKLGADRIANLAALSEMTKIPALLIDCGTAINAELLSEKKVFLGGPIAPGRLLQRKSLSSYTAQLPFIPIEKQNAQTYGRNTEDAIIIGTDIGVIGAVREFISYTKKRFQIDALEVYIGGGDADILLNNIEGVKRTPKEITLKGVQLIWMKNAMLDN